MSDIATLQREVSQFDEIDNLITEIKKKMEPLKEQLKILTGEKKKLQIDICSIMKSNDIEVCNLPNIPGREQKAIKHVITNSFVPVTQAQIKDTLVTFFTSKESLELNKMSPADKGLFLYNYIYNNRRKVMKETIRKIKPVKVDILENITIDDDEE